MDQDQNVENRIIDLPAGLPPSALHEVANYLNTHIRGLTIAEAREAIQKSLKAAKAELDQLTQKVIKVGLAEWAGADDERQSLIVRGQGNLLNELTLQDDLERIRQLFNDLEGKREIIQLLGASESAEGVRIFIGSENKLFSMSGSSLVVAPFRDAQRHVVGVLGVIGPTRLNYARIIPTVDYTAKLVSRLIKIGILAAGSLKSGRLRVDFLSWEADIGELDPLIACAAIRNLNDQANKRMGACFFMSNQSRPNPAEPDAKGAVDSAAPEAEARPNTTAADEQAAAVDSEAGEVSVDQLKSIVEALQSELEAKEAELAEKHDALLRNMAETENVRRRLEREKDEVAKYAIAKFAKDVLTIGDNFERAIDAVPKDAVANDPALKSLHDGIVVAERDYRSILERHGVKVINSTGQPFNPHYHQAVVEQENTEVPAGTVLQVYQSGYLIGDRCLRPAMVVVSRGGPKAPKASAAAQGQNSAPDEVWADTQSPDEPAGQASDDTSSLGK